MGNFRTLMRSDQCVIEQVVFDRYKEIDGLDGVKRTLWLPETAARGTRGHSMMPGHPDLARMDAGGYFGEIGVIRVPPVKNPDGLREGDAVIYNQYSARSGFTRQSAELLKDVLQLEGDCYIIPMQHVVGVLEDGVPEPGRVW